MTMENVNVSEISFQKLVDCEIQYDGVETIVRGFVYQATDGVVILAKEPNLKSCCIGSLTNHQGQIMLSGFELSEKSNRAVAMRGKLYSESGFGYRMEDAVLLQEEGAFPVETLKIFLIITVLAGALFLQNWRKFNLFKRST
jgi:hypothetical protein